MRLDADEVTGQPRDPVTRLLLACIRSTERSPAGRERDRQLAAVDQRRFLSAADYHRISGFAYRALHGHEGLDPSVAAALELAHHLALHGHLQVLAALRDVMPVLESLGAPWMVVKGPVLTADLYRRAGLRNAGDLDLVVPASAFSVVVDALEDSGWSMHDVNWVRNRRITPGEVHLEREGGVIVDLHWHLVNSPDRRARFGIDMEQLLERRRPVEVHGMQVPTLDPTDTLLHLALHACGSGGDRLVWIADVERAVVVGQPDWDVVVHRARSARLGLVTALMLSRARRLLGAPVPDEVLEALAPPSFRNVTGLLDRVFPPERAGRRPWASDVRLFFTGRIVGDIRSTLTGWARDLPAAAVRSARRAYPRTTGPRPHEHRIRAGDESDRRAYFAAVASAGRDTTAADAPGVG